VGITRIVLKELWHRKVGALIILLSIVICVAMIIAVQRVSLGSIDERRRAMKVFGKNIVILPQDVSLDDYWASDFGEHTLPQAKVKALADYFVQTKVLARHFLGSLQKKVSIDGHELVLSGVMVEMDPAAPRAVTAGAQKPIPPGSAQLGWRAAEELGLKKGGVLDGEILLDGRPLDAEPFKIIKVQPETGTIEDFKVYIDIAMAQKLFGMGQVVNTIEALNCMCSASILPVLARKIETQLFSGKGGSAKGNAYHFLAIAQARYDARKATMRDAILLSSAIFLFGALLIAIYSVLNVQERRREIGVLLAIAARPIHVAGIVVYKMVLLGVAGGLIGCLVGDWLATGVGAQVINRIHPAMRAYLFKAVGWQRYGAAVVIALVISVLPSLIGVFIASRTDPADTLRES
jgi:putative ABC transport system permease protein